MRSIFYFPIIHTLADMGTLRDSVQLTALSRFGSGGLKRKVMAIDEIWNKIERLIDTLPLPYERLRIYQDGLPICGRETDIVKELAGDGSRNYRLLVKFMARGATIMGTESADLLMEEYRLIKELMVKKNCKTATEDDVQSGVSSRSLIERRDQFIARRINTTLLEGETGVLFLGMLHSLEGLLDGDIQVIYPMGKGVERK